MCDNLIKPVANCNEKTSYTHAAWCEEAEKPSIDLTGFDANASLQSRLAWAEAAELELAMIYDYVSLRNKCSQTEQIHECITWAVNNRLYVPPELICIDRAIAGRKTHRDGLHQMKALLQREKLPVSTVLVPSLSRLFRHTRTGIQFVQKEIVEKEKRLVAVCDNIDSDNKAAWAMLF